MHALLLHGASARLDYGDPKAHLVPSCDTPPPVGSEVYAMRSLPARNITTPHPPSFYLHDQGAHDWSDEEDLHWSLSPFSKNMCPGRAQHQGGIYVLQALRQHWARSRDKHNASVHVSAALKTGALTTRAQQHDMHLQSISKGYRPPAANKGISAASVLRKRSRDHAARSQHKPTQSIAAISRAHSAFMSGRKLVHTSICSTEAAVAARLKDAKEIMTHSLHAHSHHSHGNLNTVAHGEHLHSSDVSRTINFGQTADAWRKRAEEGTHDQQEAVGWMTKAEGVVEHNNHHGATRERRASITQQAIHATKAKVWQGYMRLPVLSPMTKARRAWDVLIAVAVVFYCLILPWQLCVEWWPYAGVKSAFYVLDFVFWTDMVLNFCTGFVHHGDLVMDRKEIFEHYMQKWFWVDLVANFPFEAAFSGFSKSERKAVKLLKWFKLGTLLRAGRLMKYMNQYLSFPKLPKATAVFFVITHVLTCAWVGVFWSEAKQQQMGLANEHMHMYVCALEGTLQRLVGTSTRHAFEKSEAFYVHPDHRTRTFTIITFIIGMCFLFWFIGYTAAVLTHGTDVYHRWHAKMKQMQQMVDYHQLPHEMAARLHMQAQYAWQNKIVDQALNLHHDETLNMNLRRQVALFIHRNLLEQTSLCSNCSLDCLAEVALHVRISVYFPGDVVVFQGERGKEMYYIKKGELQVRVHTGTEVPGEEVADKVVATMHPGQSFGEISLVENGVTSATIEAVTISELLALSKTSCDQICELYPSFRNMMQDAAAERRKADSTRVQQVGSAAEMSKPEPNDDVTAVHTEI